MKSATERYILGLDLGISSIGWARFLCSVDRTPVGFPAHDALGSFCYPSPVTDVVKGRRITNRTNRGAKRRARHRLDHFKSRRRRLTRLLVDIGWLPSDADELHRLQTRKLRRKDGQIEMCHPVALKVRALSEAIADFDLGIIFLHYLSHRGYLSTADLPFLLRHERPPVRAKKDRPAKSPEDAERQTDEQKELVKLEDQIQALRDKLQDKTVSQWQLQQLESGQPLIVPFELANRPPVHFVSRGAIRARKFPSGRTKERILNHIAVTAKLSSEELKKVKKKLDDTKMDAAAVRYDRWMYIDEFDQIWHKQADIRPKMTDELRREIESLIFHQLPLESKEDMVGTCELLPNYRRCRQAELVFQRHRIIANLAHQTLEGQPLTPEQRRLGLEFLMDRDEVTWDELRRAIGAGEERFGDEPNSEPKSEGGNKRKKKTQTFKRDTVKGSAWGCAIGNVLNVSGATLANGDYDALVHDLITIANPTKLYPRLLRVHGLSDGQAMALMGTSHLQPKGYANRCSRVLRRIEPFMLAGTDLYQAIHDAGYKTADRREIQVTDRIEVASNWTTGNPSVDAAVRWSAKVINQIVDRYGKPEQIRVELPRQMAMGNEARFEETRRMDKRRKRRQTLADQLTDHGFPVTRRNLELMMLWEESNHQSPYRPDKKIELNDLIQNYTVDHIYPRSFSPIDEFENKVLASHADNGEKGDRLPYTWLQNDLTRFNAMSQFIHTLPYMSKRKKQRLLATALPDETEMEARMLTQMGYVGTQVTAALRTLGVEVVFVNGSAVSEVRHVLGLHNLMGDGGDKPATSPERIIGLKMGPRESFASEKDRSDLRHHAVDAAVAALIDRSMYHRLQRHAKAVDQWKRQGRSGDRPSPALAEPFPNVRQSLLQLLPSIPVVRPPSRGRSGPLHKETLLSPTLFAGQKGIPNTFDVRGQHVLRFGPSGTVTGGWEKSSNHHSLVFRSLSGTKYQVVAVTLFEVAQRIAINDGLRRRGQAVRPVIDKSPRSPLMPYLMNLASGDTIEYAGEKGHGPGYYIVGTVAVGNNVEVSLIPVTSARLDPKGPGSVRLYGNGVSDVSARVIRNVFGEVVYREPHSDD